MAPQNIPRAVVLTLGNKVVLYLWFWFAQVLTPEANPQWMESEDLVMDEVLDDAGECLLPWWRSILPAWLLDLRNADAVAGRPA